MINVRWDRVLGIVVLMIILAVTVSCSSQVEEKEDDSYYTTGRIRQNIDAKDLGDEVIVQITTNSGEIVDIDAEVVKTRADIEKGLMFREHMDEDRGMLFIFGDVKKRYFWMKNTLIPLDMIFISEEQEIASIQKNAVPCKADPYTVYPSNESAKYVLEVNSGITSELGISVGDSVRFVLGSTRLI